MAGTSGGTGAAGERAIVVVSAMPLELRPLARALRLRPDRADGLAVRRGRVPGGPVVAAVVGVGPAAARRVTSQLLDALPVARVLMVGVAGGVSPQWPVRSLMTPAVVVDQSTGLRLRPDHAAGVAPAGTLLTCSTISTGVDASRLRADGVDAVDMETAAVGTVCHERGVPWAAYRAMSDTLDDGLVDEDILALTRPDGGMDPAAVAKLLVRQPSAVRRLARLGLDTKGAVAAATAGALKELGQADR